MGYLTCKNVSVSKVFLILNDDICTSQSSVVSFFLLSLPTFLLYPSIFSHVFISPSSSLLPSESVSLSHFQSVSPLFQPSLISLVHSLLDNLGVQNPTLSNSLKTGQLSEMFAIIVSKMLPLTNSC